MARVGQDWVSVKAQLDELTDAEARTACQREWLAPLLIALGYEWQPAMRPAEDGTLIPIAGEIARANGQPELWLLEAVDLSNELADPLSLPVNPGETTEDALTWEGMITDDVLSGPEPPAGCCCST